MLLFSVIIFIRDGDFCSMMDNGDRDYMDVSYVPSRERGRIWVDTSALNFVGTSQEREDSEVARLQTQRAKSCLNFLRNRGRIVTTAGVFGEIRGTVNHYKNRRSEIRRDIYRGRLTQRKVRARNIKSSPLRQTLRNNRDYLLTYRSLYGFLERETEKNFLEGINNYEFSIMCGDINATLEGRKGSFRSHEFLCDFLETKVRKSFSGLDSEFSSICNIWSYIVYRDDISKLSFQDKELLAASIYAGDGCGLFSADIPMILTYREAVKQFSLSDCFVCDGVNSRTDWLGR